MRVVADRPAEIPAHQKLGTDALQGEAVFTADSLDVTHTRVANQNTRPFSSLLDSLRLHFSVSNMFFCPFFFSLASLLLPQQQQQQPFLDHQHHHSREGSMQKGIAAGAIACYVCLSPSVIVVDFDRCPQKHCSICAPF